MIRCIECDITPGEQINMDVPRNEYEPTMIGFEYSPGRYDWYCPPCLVRVSTTDPYGDHNYQLTWGMVRLVSAQDAVEHNAEEYWEGQFERSFR